MFRNNTPDKGTETSPPPDRDKNNTLLFRNNNPDKGTETPTAATTPRPPLHRLEMITPIRGQ